MTERRGLGVFRRRSLWPEREAFDALPCIRARVKTDFLGEHCVRLERLREARRGPSDLASRGAERGERREFEFGEVLLRGDPPAVTLEQCPGLVVERADRADFAHE